MSDISRHRMTFDNLQLMTKSAYLIQFDENDKNTHLWILKSRCEIISLPHDDLMGEIVMEDWLIDDYDLKDFMI